MRAFVRVISPGQIQGVFFFSSSKAALSRRNLALAVTSPDSYLIQESDRTENMHLEVYKRTTRTLESSSCCTQTISSNQCRPTFVSETEYGRFVGQIIISCHLLADLNIYGFLIQTGSLPSVVVTKVM